MRRIKSLTLLCAAVCCLAAAAPAPAAARGNLKLSGRITLEGHPTPPRFTVHLYFPKAANRPPVVTVTDGYGWFEFTNLDAGRYLLEVHQGEALVYQKAVDLDGSKSTVEIPINLKPASGGA